MKKSELKKVIKGLIQESGLYYSKGSDRNLFDKVNGYTEDQAEKLLQKGYKMAQLKHSGRLITPRKDLFDDIDRGGHSLEFEDNPKKPKKDIAVFYYTVDNSDEILSLSVTKDKRK